MKNQKGFTLVEVVLTAFILSVIMLAAFSAFYNFFKVNVLMNERAIKAVLATERVEEWKSVKGENFAPGVQFPVYTPTVSGGTITFSRTLVAIPAVTQLSVDCTTNLTLTQNSGYSYSLIQGTYTNPGYGSTSNCWVHPKPPRAAGDTTPGNVVFVITCPASVSATLEMQLIDYATMQRSERVIINNLVKGTYTATDLVPPNGKSTSFPLTSVDTSTGNLTIEIEQTGIINNAVTVIDDCYSSVATWTRYPSTVTKANITTPFTPLPYTETDTKCMSIKGPGSSGQYVRRTLNTTSASIGDSITAWVYLDDNEKCWFNTPAGSSNTAYSDTTKVYGDPARWTKLSKVITASSERTTSTPITIKFEQITTPNTADTLFVNQVSVEKVTAPNPNAVISNFTLKSLVGFTDPDSSPGAPIPPPGSHYPYIITSSVAPTDVASGQPLGWVVTVTVSKQNEKFKPVTVSNTINR